jgi:hypothetical protein
MLQQSLYFSYQIEGPRAESQAVSFCREEALPGFFYCVKCFYRTGEFLGKLSGQDIW